MAWPALADCVSLPVKSIGKPDARNGHVRFDGRGRETGRRFGVSTRARPRLYNESRYCNEEENGWDFKRNLRLYESNRWFCLIRAAVFSGTRRTDCQPYPTII